MPLAALRADHRDFLAMRRVAEKIEAKRAARALAPAPALLSPATTDGENR